MPESVTRYARTEDGVRIAFEFVEGCDPILFVSPMLGSQPTLIESAPPWVEYRNALRGGNAMACFSFRGIGLSGPPPRPVTLPDLVRDVEAVANALPDRELYVFGAQGGAVPALEFAAAHPERIRGFFLDGPTRLGGAPAALAAMKADMHSALFMACRSYFDWEEEEGLAARAREWAQSLPEEIFWRIIAACEDYDFSSALKRISVPVIVRGYDYCREEAAEIAAEVPGVLLDLEREQMLGPAQGQRQRELMAPYLDAPGPTNGASPASAVPDPSAWGLTARQLEVLQLVAQGLPNKAIAIELEITPGTARRHMSDILERTGQPNRTAAARFALDHGLIN